MLTIITIVASITAVLTPVFGLLLVGSQAKLTEASLTRLETNWANWVRIAETDDKVRKALENDTGKTLAQLKQQLKGN